MFGRTLSVWVMAGAAAFLLMEWARSTVKLNTRARELAVLAERFGMMPLERNTLPAGMTLIGTQLQQWVRIVNVYVGEIGGAEVAFFDCTLDIGTARCSQTVIARRRDSTAGLLGTVGPDNEVERAGEWQALFPTRRLFNFNRPFMSIQRLETTLVNLSKLGGQ